MTVFHISPVIPILYVVLQLLALGLMRSNWQFAATLPALAMGASLTMFILGILTNAGGAAVWLVLGLPVATAYLLFLLPIYFLVGRMPRRG